jgi:hypothetical protein
MAVQYEKAIKTFITEQGGDELALMRFMREVWDQARQKPKPSF